MHRIVVLGFMGSGKTTIGKQLAENLQIPFLDSDHIIAEKAGMSINEIFAAMGEQAFRRMEEKVIEDLSALPEFVLAVGGGMPAIPGVMERLNQLGTTVYLEVSRYELLRRLLKDRSQRPLLKDKTEIELKEYIDQLYHARQSFYLKASLVLQNDALDFQDVLKALNLR